MPEAPYDFSVFVNCPFDDDYHPLFDAIIFTIHDCGYAARCAIEVDDASEVRIEKIAKIITACRFGIHDISRTEADATTGLPRFNMPLELGMFLGAKRYGRGQHRLKNCLILDVERYRFQKFISDIAGQDIAAHGGEPTRAIKAVRDWLSNATYNKMRIPAASVISGRYQSFLSELPTMCDQVHHRPDELTFNDYVTHVEEWLRLNQKTVS